MRGLNICLLVCLISCAVHKIAAKRGFILTAPKVIDAGSTEYFTLTVFDVPSGEQVILTLLHSYTGTVMAKSEVNVVNNYNVWIEMVVPPVSADMDAKLLIEGSFSNGYRIKAEKRVKIRHNSVITFIETDKPLYKPGQIVRFRVLPMDSQLKPLGNNTIGDVWIEDPSNIRVAQWKQVKFTGGMLQLELPLSEEPTLGAWSIKSVINKVPVNHKFKVEKYVLPKFEVKINPPEYLMADAQVISAEICAWYTYGKKVDGTLKAKMTYQRHNWEKEQPIPSVEYIGQISGCHEFTVNAQDIFFSTSEFGYRTIKIMAEVTENGTEIVRNSSATVTVTHTPLLLKFLWSESASGYFKPGIPFNGKLKAQKPDGTPAPSEKIEICAEFFASKPGHSLQQRKKMCHIFTSNKHGLIHFSVAPVPSSLSKIQLEAKAYKYIREAYEDEIQRVKIDQPQAYLQLSPWHSPSGCYLQIEPIVDELECEKLKRVKIRYTAEKGKAIKFFHQVLSRGRIVQQGSHQRTLYTPEEDGQYNFDLSNDPAAKDPFNDFITDATNSTDLLDAGEFSLSFDPRATMAPVARLLVFYVREDGEVIADSEMFRIEKCLLNKVGLHFRHEQQYPSTDATMLLSASPFSVCGIGMLDKSIRLLQHDSQFNKKKLFELMETYDIGKTHEPRQVDEDYCENKDSANRPTFSSYASLARSTSKHVDSMMAFEEAGTVVISDLELQTRPCVNDFPIAVPFSYGNVLEDRGFPLNMYSLGRLPGRMEDNVAARRGPPSPLPISDLKPTSPPKSTEEIRSYFPETWLWEMHTVGSSGEMALTRKLPHTITEWTGGAICIHPKTGLGISEPSSITAFQPFFLSFQLPYSVVRGETLPLVISVFNYLTECLPIKLSLEPSEDYKILTESRSQKICVCGGESVSTSFTLRPVSLGLLNITVYGYSLEEDDEVCGDEITARLSARDAATKQLLVEAEGFPKEEVFNYYICPEDTNGTYASEVDLLLPENVVDGSARAYMSVSGDLMGPALNGLKSLVRLPVGCGEQNMVLFVPNIFVLDYLSSVSKISEEIKQECLNNMRKGYQRELQYRHGDGSYSAFGRNDIDGSLWLTAFVLRSFGQARRFIDIDEHDLRLSTTWILEKQFENGCFEPTGYLHQKSLKGGLNEGEQSLSPLAAYVLISLLESGAVKPYQVSIKNALKCLEADSHPNSYGLALFSYAVALSGELSSAETYLKLLEDKAIRKGNLMFWDTSKSKSVSIEIAGYYILAKLAIAENSSESIAQVQPVIRWITRQRNTNGGFVSTQDTVIALQALATFASRQSQKSVDIGLVIETDELVQGFKVEEDNKLVTQTKKIPVLPAVVDFQAVGEGCILVQYNLRYNVKNLSGQEAFDLSVNVLRHQSSNCNMPKIGICMRYKVLNQTSNMVVVSVKMASGFLPEEESLQKLESDPNVQLKRHDTDGNEVNLYFNELTDKQKCFHFFIQSEINVEDIQPASIHLYDYYEPEMKVIKEYVIPSACSVATLPELPIFPPIIIDTEDDRDLETFIDDSTAVLSETITILPELSTINENMTLDYFPELNISSEQATEFNNASQFAGSLDVVELSDDASVLEAAVNSSNLDNFIDVSYDLDVPDGIEGNMPVSILPPDETTETIMTTMYEEDCPVCEEDFPENFSNIYCSSAFALRVMVKNEGNVKILHDVSSDVPQPKIIRKFATLEYNSRCLCPQVHEKGKILLVIGTPITLWNTEKDKHQLQLNNKVFIIASSKSVQPTELRKAKSQCNNDP